MRTTVTLDTDTEEVVRKRMQERGQSFKQALNDIIREGATGARPAEPFRTKVASMGVSAVNLDRALQVAADLEDDDLIRRKRSGS